MKISCVSFLLLGLLLLNAFVAFGQQQQSRGQQQEQEHHQQEQEHQQQQQQQQQGPYVFQEQHFSERFKTEHGRIRELPRFTQRSELLRGIDNFRFAVLEADPNTFIVPNHLDAELVVFVGQGNGAISYVLEDRTETLDIQRGDIFRVPAGITHFFVNKDNNQKLVLVKLLQPVSNPGQYEPFFGAGGENPQSFYRAFSNEVLEAIFQSRNVEEIKRIFRQRQGVIVKATQQQIQELSQSQHHGSRPWPFRRGQSQSEEKVNIFEKQPTQQNQFGKLYEVSSNELQSLREINVAVNFANITRGGMTTLVYNSKAWKLAFVLSQDGYFEVACPHLSQQQQQQPGQSQQQQPGQSQGQGEGQYQPGQGEGRYQPGQSQGQGQYQPGQGEQQQQPGQGEQYPGQSRQQPGQGRQQEQGQGGPVYQRVSGPLRRATLVVVPPGHPAVFVASNNNNLEVVCFDINANGNQKIQLAGRGNVYNQLENVAKGLAFGAPGREVEELFNRNKEQYFFRGPQQQQGGGRADE